jgi:PAS domain S-box-containing protein
MSHEGNKMKDQNKTKKQLINELTELRQRFDKLETLEKEHRQKEGAPRESEEQLRLITDSLPVLISYIDSEQRYRFNNRAYERWFGYLREEVYGKHIKEVLGESAYEVIRPYVEVALSGQEVGFENWVPYKDGGNRYVGATYVPHFGEQRQVKGFFALVDDLTEHKRKDEELERYEQSLEKLVEERTTELRMTVEELQREISEGKSAKEELLRAQADWENIFQAIGHPTLILDPEHKVIAANRAAVKASGITEEDLRSKKCYEIFHGTDQPPEGCPLEKMSVSGHLETIEIEMEALGGCFLVSCTPVFDEKGDLRNIIHIATDITEQKRLEKILEKERQELKLIIDTSPIIIFYKDKEGEFIRVNKAFAEALKMPEEDLMGKTVFDLYSAKIAQGMTNDDHEVLKSVCPKLNIIEQYESASGIRWVQTDKIPICDKNGIPVGLIGFAQDITERKRAEETLRESQELYRSLFEGVPVGLYRTMPGGEILDTNLALVEMLGYPDRESLLVVNLVDMYVNPEDCKRWEALMESRGVVHDFEAQFRRYGSTVIWIRNTCRAVRHGDGEILYHEGAIQDITERKRAEEALRESEERYRALFEESRDVIYITTREGKFIDINKSGLELFGYTKEEMMSLSVEQIYFDPDDRPRFQQEIERKGFVRDYEIKFRKKDGTEIDCLVSAIVQRANDGSILGYQGIIRDITERKQAEEQLRKSQQLLAKTFSSLREAVFIIAADTVEIIDCNPAASEIFGYRREEMLGRQTAFLHIDEAALEEFRRHLNSAIAEEGFLSHLEFKMKRKDGIIFSTEHYVMPLEDEQGRRVSWVSVVHDITERKRAEEQLRSSREQLRALSAHLQSIREEERTLISREIHDELGQDLTGLKMDLSWLIKRLPKNQELDVKKVESMLKLVDTTIQSVRRISTKLRPGVLDDLGLTAAIEWQAQDFQTRTGIQCEFNPNLREIDLDRDRSTTVFRIFQETLTNVARHASATRVNICLNEEAAGLVLIVEDNGRGIKEREISDPKSLGLLGMRERALIFGGEVTISGAPGKGTTVMLRIPLQR